MIRKLFGLDLATGASKRRLKRRLLTARHTGPAVESTEAESSPEPEKSEKNSTVGTMLKPKAKEPSWEGIGSVKQDEAPIETIEDDGSEPNWDELGLIDELLKGIEAMKFDKPMPVQRRTIPYAIKGGDYLVQAKTGSGKTLAFGLPILQGLDFQRKTVQAVVLTPTRELCLQVSEEISSVGRALDPGIVPVYGGASMHVQVEKIQRGARILVGTPGRVLDHLKRGTLSFDAVSVLVLDEADEMLDKGFLPDVSRILDYMPQERTTMCFSATLPAAINRLAQSRMQNPRLIRIGSSQGFSINRDVKHFYYKTPTLHRFVTLVNLLHSIPRTKVLVFCNTKMDTENIAEYLNEEGFSVGFLSGNLSQAVRNRTLDAFRDGVIDILVATDVAARGLDIYGVSHVINYDLPESTDLYLHRTGRTGRAGKAGIALSLVTPRDLLQIGAIPRKIGIDFNELPVPQKEDVQAGYKKFLIDRMKAMAEDEEFSDEVALLADDLLEAIEPHPLVSALLTFLRQRGFSFDQGYDPENPEFRDMAMARPPLIGTRDLREQSRQRRDTERGSRKRREGSSDRHPRRDKGERRDRESGDKPRQTKERNYTTLEFSKGRNTGMKGPSDFIRLVCQTAGIKKYKIGKITIEDERTCAGIDESCVKQVLEAFEKVRNKDLQLTVKPLESSPKATKGEKTDKDRDE